VRLCFAFGRDVIGCAVIDLVVWILRSQAAVKWLDAVSAASFTRQTSISDIKRRKALCELESDSAVDRCPALLQACRLSVSS
jgi:hypothetical protein